MLEKSFLCVSSYIDININIEDYSAYLYEWQSGHLDLHHPHVELLLSQPEAKCFINKVELNLSVGVSLSFSRGQMFSL